MFTVTFLLSVVKAVLLRWRLHDGRIGNGKSHVQCPTDVPGPIGGPSNQMKKERNDQSDHPVGERSRPPRERPREVYASSENPDDEYIGAQHSWASD